MKKLTVIIPFLNEGEEVRNTVESILSYGGDQTDILLINDGSTDGYDYKGVAQKFGADYIEHRERRGVAASRDEGVDRCTTPYFLLLDGHMRFYDALWCEQIITELESNDRQLLCCQTRVLQRSEEGIIDIDTSRANVYGAKINISNTEGILDFQWLLKELHPECISEDIPCVLGAAYAASKRYWQYLGGLSGLLYYGSDEVYISMKVWLEGGKCKLLKNIVIGHLYRKSFPYPIDNRYTYYNKLFISELLLPVNVKKQVFARLQKQNQEIYAEAFKLLIDNRKIIRELKEYYQTIFVYDFNLIVQLNNDR